MQKRVKPLTANNIPVCRFAVIAKPKYFAIQGNANEAATIKDALKKNFMSLYRMKIVTMKAANIKIVVIVSSITIQINYIFNLKNF